MRLHTLELTGFGPFKETQRIDFDALSADGLFMLEGPTGAGKSAIIDSIVWALYGKTAHEGAALASNSGNRASDSQFSRRIRSDYCSDLEETQVSLVFSCGGERYRIRRTPKMTVQKRNTEGTRDINPTVKFEFVTSKKEALTRIEEVYRKVSDVIGMEIEQFSQLMVLPQGDFATFLHSSSESRREVLQNIFRTYFYEDLEKHFSARRKSVEDAVANHCKEIDRHLRNLSDEVPEIEGDLSISILIERIIDLNEPRSTKDVELAKLRKQLFQDPIRHSENAIHVAGEIDKSRKTLSELEIARDLIEQRSQWENRHKELRDDEDRIKKLGIEVQFAKKAKPFAMIIEAAKLAKEAKESAFGQIDATLIQLTTSQAKKKIAEVRTKRTKLASELRTLEKESAQYSVIERKIEDAREIEESSSNLAIQTRALVILEKQLKKLETALEFYKLERNSGMVAVLVKGLRKGKPCPVCGSIDHPSPYKKTEDFDFDVEQQMSEKLNDKKMEIQNCRNDIKVALRISSKGTESSKGLLTKLKALDVKVKQQENLEANANDLDEELNLLEESLEYIVEYERAGREQSKWERTLESEMLDAGFSSLSQITSALATQTEMLEEEIENHRLQLNQMETLLKQKTFAKLPDKEKVEINISQIGVALSDLEGRKILADAMLARITFVNERVTKTISAVCTELDDLGAVKTEGEVFVNLDRWARGDNQLNLSLTNFVLQERLEMILERASNHLRKVSNGKYEFRLFEETVGRQRKAGLGIVILDNFTGKERPTETLSGGETFYASLALALGLAEIVKSDQGGVELGTLFIDEGFGSLSDETLDEVLEVLEDLRSNDRVIGVISHVEGMKLQIPARVEVRKLEAGPSSIRMTVSQS